MSPPRVTLDGAGVRVEYETADGSTRSFPLSVESALELVAELTAKLHALKDNPDMQGRLGAAAAKTLFAWFKNR